MYSELAQKIIRAQEQIIGPLAYDQALKVRGVIISQDKNQIKLNGDEKEILSNLINQYEKIFGQSSVQVCRDAVKSITSNIPKEELPETLL